MNTVSTVPEEVLPRFFRRTVLISAAALLESGFTLRSTGRPLNRTGLAWFVRPRNNHISTSALQAV